MLLQLASLVLLVGLGFYLYSADPAQNQELLRIEKQHGCEPPSHAPRPFFGMLRVIQMIKADKNFTALEELGRDFVTYGHTFHHVIFGRQTIWTDDPQVVKAVLSDQFPEFELGRARIRAYAPILGRGIFMSDGKEWSHLRSTLRPVFTKSNVADLNMFEAHIQDFISRIPKNGDSFDIQELFYCYTMDITTDWLFGYQTGSLLENCDPAIKRFSSAFSRALESTTPRMLLGPLLNIYPDSDFYSSCDISNKYVDKLVAHALNTRSAAFSQNSSRYIYLHEVAKSTSNPIELRDHASNILLAGRDTSAITLSMIFFHLARSSDVLKRLHDEIAQLHGQKPTAEDLKRFTYLDQIINEGMQTLHSFSQHVMQFQWLLNTDPDIALRLYPPVPTNARETIKATTLPVGGGPSGISPIAIRKNTTIIYSVWHMQRRKDIWGDDADEFRPERWEGRKKGPEFQPFNGGPRICMGRK